MFCFSFFLLFSLKLLNPLSSIFFLFVRAESFRRLYGGELELIVFLLSIKDGAYYCYCAYVLRISRYSDFLSVMLTNTGIFLRGLKLPGESRS